MPASWSACSGHPRAAADPLAHGRDGDPLAVQPSSKSLTALILTLLAAALLVLSLGGYTEPAESLVLRPLAGVQSWVALRFAALRDLLTSPRDVATLRGRNAELEAQVASLQQQVIALQEQVAESEVLAALLDYARSRPASRYLAADVIGEDASPFLRSVWIGTGSDAGVARGMPVVTERGLVGRIVEVHATVSRVQLITDPEAAVNVLLQDSRADGVLTAQPNGEIRVDLISQEAEVSNDELVLTSGLGGGYPADIPVGRVVSVRRRDFEVFQEAVIQPAVDFERIQIVLVITTFPAAPGPAEAP
jgi:rod shape-determining protein MreC